MGVATCTQKPIKPKGKLKTFRNLVKTCQMTLNNHAKFHGDWTIGGTIKFNKASKTQDFYGKWPQIARKCSYIHTNRQP